MNKWLVLHNDSKFSRALRDVLGKQATAIHVDELVNKVAVQAHIGQSVNHRWVSSGRVVDDFYQRTIFQEVFFSVESALYQYDQKDKHYVQFSWQAYLLSLFSCAKTVINPVTPSNLSVSYYQFPRLLMLAGQVGFRVPRYEIGRVCKEGYQSVDTLWYWPGRENIAEPIMNVEIMEGIDQVVHFVRYDQAYIVCWPKVPKEVEKRLLMLCNKLDVYVGEASFRVGKDWTFYGLRPQIQTDGCDDIVLLDIAECLRDIGNEGII